jgi:hypothetical protein
LFGRTESNQRPTSLSLGGVNRLLKKGLPSAAAT